MSWLQEHVFTASDVQHMNDAAHSYSPLRGELTAWKETGGYNPGNVTKWFANNTDTENLVVRDVIGNTRLDLYDEQPDPRRKRLVAGMLLTDTIERQPLFTGNQKDRIFTYSSLARCADKAFHIMTCSVTDYFLSVAWFQLEAVFTGQSWLLVVTFKERDPVLDGSGAIYVIKHQEEDDLSRFDDFEAGQEIENGSII